MKYCQEGNIINFSEALIKEAEAKIENLFWDDPILYSKLCTYCETMKIGDQKAEKALIIKGFLDKDGSIPKHIRQAVFELTTGIKIQDK